MAPHAAWHSHFLVHETVRNLPQQCAALQVASSGPTFHARKAKPAAAHSSTTMTGDTRA